MEFGRFLILAFFISSSKAARILGIVPAPSYSHQMPFQAIFRELSLRGHEVTVITSNPQNNPALTNLTEIDLSSSYDLLKNFNYPELVKKSYFAFIDFKVVVLNGIVDHILSNPKVKSMIQNESEHFDLVLVEMMAPTFYAFSERFKCPFIGISSGDTLTRNYRISGNPTHPVLYPDVQNVSVNLTFWDRLFLVFSEILEMYVNSQYIFPTQQILMEKHFGKNYPKLEEIEKKMSLLFVNTDLIIQTIRPVLPNIIRIGGGLHIKPLKPLPQELQDLLDKATQGAIYFSLGSNVKSKDLSEKTRKLFLDAFSELPYLILWKFEADGVIESSKNLKISKWFPQQDILRHPNVKLFITQGGLQSTEEAIHSKVPMLVIPFIGDQVRNARVVVDRGIGHTLDHAKLTKKTLKNTILNIINTPSYYRKIKQVLQLIIDDPMTGLERAIWWSEYVIRHKGAQHLQVNEISWYEYYLLDVIGFCSIVVGVVLYLLVKTVKIAVCFIKKKLTDPKKKTQ